MAHLGIYPSIPPVQNTPYAGWMSSNFAWVLFGLPVG